MSLHHLLTGRGLLEKKPAEEVGEAIADAFDDVFSGNLGQGSQRQAFVQSEQAQKDSDAKEKESRGKTLNQAMSDRNRQQSQAETNVARFSMAGKSAFDDDAFTAGAQELDMDGPDF